MNPLYSIAGIATSALLHLVAPFHRKARLIIEGRRETPQRLKGLTADRPVVWFHASSLGEFEQGRPLMEAWRKAHPEYQILLSFFSPSGYEVRRDYAGADVVVYLPSDRTSSVRRFLDLAHPAVAIFIKYDFWPTMLSELATRSIPTYLVSAIFRPDQLFFRSYGGWYLRLLHLFRRLYVQDEASRTPPSGAWRRVGRGHRGYALRPCRGDRPCREGYPCGSGTLSWPSPFGRR